MMLIQIQETHPAAPGKKMAAVVDASGQRYGVWPEHLAKLRIGGTYDVDVESWDSNGRTLQKIVKFAPVNGATPNSNGTTKPNGNGNGNTGSAPAASSAVMPGIEGEAEFVGRALHALILKGDVTMHMQRVLDATLMLREVWRISARQANGGGAHHG